ILTSALQDGRLSPEAGWLLVFMLSQAKRWRFNVAHVAKHRRMGRDRLYAAIKELRGFGYCRRDEHREKKSGTLTGYEYLFTDEPHNFGDCDPLTEDQEPGGPLPEVPETEPPLPEDQDAYKKETPEIGKTKNPPSPPQAGGESETSF